MITDLNAQRGDLQAPVYVGRTGTVVVIGDSYAQGVDLLQPRQESWPALLGRSLDKTVWVDAVGGTGYINEGFCGKQSFRDRANSVSSRKAEFIIIQGGLNDASFTAEQIRAAVTTTLGELDPGAKVYLVGPTLPPAVDPTGTILASNAIQASAVARKRVFVSGLNLSLVYGPDGVHPTAVGQARFAELVTEAVRDGNP